MNKEIKDRLDKLENELKESKDEIHSLKSSVSLKIERGIGKLLSRFTRKQIILGFLLVLFSISIIGIAGTVTKTYTFSSGDVVSASKINTNFDTLYTLVNENLDGANMSIDPDSLVLFGTPNIFQGNLGGRSGADAKCLTYVDNELFSMINSCSNVRAVISVSSSDEVRDMASNYGIPTNKKIRGRNGMYLGKGWDNITGGSSGTFGLDYFPYMGIPEFSPNHVYWTGSQNDGSLHADSCNSWTSSSYTGVDGRVSNPNSTSNIRYVLNGGSVSCGDQRGLLCVCF
jgi:hypothetical protein